jgi:hypothetical protein
LYRRLGGPQSRSGRRGYRKNVGTPNIKRNLNLGSVFETKQERERETD